MLCVPRSWAASPWVIERITVSLSATWAVWGSVWLNFSPSILVAIEPMSPRYSIGANGLGSNVSWWAIPPGRKMWITESALAVIGRVILQVGPRLEPQDVGQGQSTQTDRADRQEPSAIHRVERNGRLPSRRLLLGVLERDFKCAPHLRRSPRQAGHKIDERNKARSGHLDTQNGQQGPVAPARMQGECASTRNKSG